MVYLRIFAQYAAVLAIALSLNFLLPRIAPGSPIYYLLGPNVVAAMSQEELADVLRQFGLDKPLWAQFLAYLRGIATGDFGASAWLGQPVWDVVFERLPWTLLLMGWSLALSAFFGTVIGVVSAWKRGGRVDVLSLAVVLFVGSMPYFWVAMLLITLFSAELGWLPSFGAYQIGTAPGSLDYWTGIAERLVMPVIALSLVQTASILITARSAMSMALDQDYITFARAKGAPERRIFYGHAFRNARLPIYTRITVEFGQLVGGALVVETVFSYPGLGSLVIGGVGARDYNLLQGVFLVATLGVILANLIADLGYPLLDPRVRRTR